MSNIILSDKIFPIKIAVSKEEQATGLMYQPWPPPIMAFPGDMEIKRFWMKNTPSPLDIIFCNNDVIVDIFVGKPFSLEELGPQQKCNLVVETPLGFVDDFNLKKGNKIKILYDIDDISRILKNKYCKNI